MRRLPKPIEACTARTCGTRMLVRGPCTILPTVLSEDLDHEFHYTLTTEGVNVAESVRFGSLRTAEPQLVPPPNYLRALSAADHELALCSIPQPSHADRFQLLVPFVSCDGALPLPPQNVDLHVPAISQLTLESNPEVLNTLCAPTCLHMCALLFGKARSHDETASLCFNPYTSTYGVWHQITWAAQKLGMAAIVLPIHNEHFLRALLFEGCCVIPCLRFDNNVLPRFPRGSTSGHLVVVSGMTADEVTVNDPAHREGSVVQKYPTDLFMRVWRDGRPLLGRVGIAVWSDDESGEGALRPEETR